MRKRNLLLLICSVVGLGATGAGFHRGRLQHEAVLAKITALDACLANNNQQAMRTNYATLRQIGKAVFQNRYQVRDQRVLNESQRILYRSQTLTDTLQALQRQLRAAGNEAQTGPLRHPESSTKRGTDITAQLARHLDRYAEFIRQYVPEATPLTQPKPGSGDSNWLYLDGTPLGAALASLTCLETQVRSYAMKALQHQAQKVGSCLIVFDKIGAMAVASSNTVAPGAVYQAQLLLTRSSWNFKPTMSADGQPIAEQPDGRGIVEFRVPPLQPGQPDTVRALWRGTIKARAYLADTAWQLAVPYLIVKQPAR